MRKPWSALTSPWRLTQETSTHHEIVFLSMISYVDCFSWQGLTAIYEQTQLNIPRFHTSYYNVTT